MPSKFIKKYSVLCTIPGEKWKEVSGKLIKKCCTRGTQEYLKDITDQAHSSLRTDSYSPIKWEELSSQDPKPQFPQGPGLVHYWLYQPYSRFQTSGPQEPWLQAITGSAKHVASFRGAMFLLHTLEPQRKL